MTTPARRAAYKRYRESEKGKAIKQRELKLEQAKEQAKYERLKKKYQEWI